MEIEHETVVEQVTRETEIDGSPADVWPALTEPEGLADWLGAELDGALAPGTSGRVVEHDGTERPLLVTEVESERRLTWLWWDPDGELSSVEVSLEPAEPAEGADGGDRADGADHTDRADDTGAGAPAGDQPDRTLVRVVETRMVDVTAPLELGRMLPRRRTDRPHLRAGGWSAMDTSRRPSAPALASR